MIPREEEGSSAAQQPAQPSADADAQAHDELLQEGALIAQIEGHFLARGDVIEGKGWGNQRAKDNDRKFHVTLACARGHAAELRLLSSCASFKCARTTKVAVLKDLLSKLDAHAAASPDCLQFVRELLPPADSAGPSAADSASAAGEPKRLRASDAGSYLMDVARLRQKLSEASKTALRLQEEMCEFERGVQEKLGPLRRACAMAELELKSLEEELKTLQSSARKQPRLDPQSMQAMQPLVDAVESGPSAAEQPWSIWSQKEWRRQESMHSKRSSQQLSDAVAMPPAERRLRGADGPLSHSRWGLVGNVQYWAEGSSECAAHLLMELISRLGLTDRMRDLLGNKAAARAAQTDTFIVNRLVEALTVLKECRSEEQRREYLIALTARHSHSKINEMVVFYIDEAVMNERFPAVEPVYDTLAGISSSYSFMLLTGEGRVAQRRWSCWCEECNLAFHTQSCERGVHRIEGCARQHLTSFAAGRITCTQAAGIANARERAKELWRKELRPKLAPGKFAAVQARELWSTEERAHLRPGHFWVLELGDAGGGTPIIKSFEQRETFEGIRFDPGESAIVVKRWLNRTADDAVGLTFVEWQETSDEKMIVNSSELRAVGFELTQQRVGGRSTPLQSVGQRRQSIVARGARVLREQRVDPSLKYRLDADEDARIRARCENS